MKVFGLTGGIASGKSTVAKILNEKRNIPVIDADILARKAVEKGSPGLEKISDEFGKDVLLPNENLNRKKLGDIIFKDKKAKETLNTIIHPEVEKLYDQEVSEYEKKGYKEIIYDCPLLIEADLTDKVGEIILVAASFDIQLKRLMDRNNLTEEEAKSRIKSQMSLDDKIPFAKYIIYNDSDYENLEEGVVYLWDVIN